MKKSALTLATTLIMSGALYAQTLNVQDGWQLVGATENVELSKLNGNCIDYIWQYDATNEDWKLHVANGQTYAYTGATVMGINAGEGFWVKGNSTCNMEISNTGTINTGFTLAMLEGNTFYAATKPAGVGTEAPYTSVATFHDDGTRSYSKNGGADSPADYQITVDGDLHVYNDFYDLKFEMIAEYSSTDAIASANVYKIIDGTYQLVGERAFFTTQADLDAFVASYFAPTNDVNVTSQAADTLAFGSFSTAYGFEEGDSDWYNAFTFATTSFTGTDYEYTGSSWEIEEDGTFSGTVTKNSDHNISIYESSEGFGADIIFTQTEQITAIDGVSYTDLYLTDIEVHVTAVGIGWTDTWDWAPTIWDGSNEVAITTNAGLRDMYLTQDNWTNDYAMLNGNAGDTSGTIVQGEVTGTVSGCTITSDDSCKKVERTTTQIGTWSFDTNGLHLDLPNEMQTLTMVSDTASPTGYYVQSVGQDKEGSIWHEKWLTGNDASQAVVQQLLQ